MIWGVHGSPGNSVTEPTWSKRTPAGTALTCAARLLYLGATSHSGQSGCCDDQT
jgi:hypothetical protein